MNEHDTAPSVATAETAPAKPAAKVAGVKERGELKTARIPIKIVPHAPQRKPEWIRVKAGNDAGRFGEIKSMLREQKLQQQSYVQAVYETGARMTHDVKNLLQSLNVLCVAAEQEAGGSDELQALMRRQLPVITQRLQQTLDKLRQPVNGGGSAGQAQSWWRGLQRSYAGQKIEFSKGEIGEEALLPRELFDSAADNLIQNAIGKRRQQGDFAISVSLACGDTARLEVCDAGRAIAPLTAAALLRGPVPSDSGKRSAEPPC